MDVKKLWEMLLAKIIAFCLDNALDEFVKILEGIGEYASFIKNRCA